MAFDQAKFDEVCRRMEAGEALRAICRSEGMPDPSTIIKWSALSADNAQQYAQAREHQAHALAEQLIEIADDGSNDWMETNDPENPGYRANGEHIQRSRLRYDARKWLTSKILPKVYGDKIDLTHAGDPNRPISVVID